MLSSALRHCFLFLIPEMQNASLQIHVPAEQMYQPLTVMTYDSQK